MHPQVRSMDDVLSQRQNTAQNFHILACKEVVVHDQVNQTINVVRELVLIVY